VEDIFYLTANRNDYICEPSPEDLETSDWITVRTHPKAYDAPRLTRRLFRKHFAHTARIGVKADKPYTRWFDLDCDFHFAKHPTANPFLWYAMVEILLHEFCGEGGRWLLETSAGDGLPSGLNCIRVFDSKRNLDALLAEKRGELAALDKKHGQLVGLLTQAGMPLFSDLVLSPSPTRGRRLPAGPGRKTYLDN
jgi:hypothetical protein